MGELRYKMDHKLRGRAVIIGNEFKYQEGLKRKKACRKDLRRMKELFTRLDFKVTIYKNLAAREIENKLKRYACPPKPDKNDKPTDKDDEKCDKRSEEKTSSKDDQKRDKRSKEKTASKDGEKHDKRSEEKTASTDDEKCDKRSEEKTANEEQPDIDIEEYDRENRESDCFVLVISTHGEEIRETTKGTGLSPAAEVWRHAVYGEDKEPLYVDQILNLFTDENAPGLAGKPKLFFLQACRSRGSDARLVRISNPKYDPGDYVNVGKVEEKGNAVKLFKKLKDTLIRKKHIIYSKQTDITNNVDDIYKDWFKDADDLVDTIDDSSEEGSENGSEDEFSEEDNDTENSEEDSSSEDEENMGEDQEDALKEADDEDSAMKKDSGELPPSSPIPDQRSPSPDLMMPPTLFDVVPITCPDNFLIMYPAMPGKTAFRSPSGSYLLKYLHKGENLSKLIHQRYNLLQYLTCVSNDMAGYEFLPDLKMWFKSNAYKKKKKLRGWMDSSIKHLSKDKTLLGEVLSEKYKECIDMDEILREQYLKVKVTQFTNKEMRRVLRRVLPFKMTACLVHRLTDNVYFSPKSLNSPMAKVRDVLTKQYKN